MRVHGCSTSISTTRTRRSSRNIPGCFVIKCFRFPLWTFLTFCTVNIFASVFSSVCLVKFRYFCVVFLLVLKFYWTGSLYGLVWTRYISVAEFLLLFMYYKGYYNNKFAFSFLLVSNILGKAFKFSLVFIKPCFDATIYRVYLTC